MLTERAEGLMRLCRLTKYASIAGAYAMAATAAAGVTIGMESTGLAAGFLFVTLMAFGPGWTAWNRSCDHRPWRTALTFAARETGVVLLWLLTIRVLSGMPLPAVASAAAGTTAFALLTIQNRWLPTVLGRLLYRTVPLRVLVLGPADAVGQLRRRLPAVDRLSIQLLSVDPDFEKMPLKLYHPDTEERQSNPAELLERCLMNQATFGEIDSVALICDDAEGRSFSSRKEIERLCDRHGLRLSVYLQDVTPDHRPPAKELRGGVNEAELHEPLLNPLHQAVKRTLDVAVAIPMVVFVLPPLCLAVRIAQRFQSPGPLFYVQERCGQYGTRFRIVKFRTMNIPASGSTDLEGDPTKRIYAAGRLLRESRLDEFPQFINVLLGSMSVVGPRAHHAPDRDRFTQLVAQYPMRLLVKPGITGLAQYREFLRVFHRDCIASRVHSDLEYIHQWSPWLDVSLIVRSSRVIVESVLRAALRRPAPAPPPPVILPVTSGALPAPAMVPAATAERRAA